MEGDSIKENSTSIIDVVELSALLQCLGFSLKSVDTGDFNTTTSGVRSVTINCQSSGIQMVMESATTACACPEVNPHGSGMWQISGIAGGKKVDQEFRSSLIVDLPTQYRDRLCKLLDEAVLMIRTCMRSDTVQTANKSLSLNDLGLHKREGDFHCETPPRCRSLEAFSNSTGKFEGTSLLAFGSNPTVNAAVARKRLMCNRQSTYTLPSMRRRPRQNKTSSPIRSQDTMLDRLIDAEKTADFLRSNLALIIKEYTDGQDKDLSISSLALDVSKISVQGSESKPQFASSPNLSNIKTSKDLAPKSKLRTFGSASSSNLSSNLDGHSDGKITKIRKLTPSMVKVNRGFTATERTKIQDSQTRTNGLFKPKIMTPVRTPRDKETSSSSASKKYSHIKSTIPRPASAKKESTQK